VLGIVLVCAFAGIEPLSTYKDDVFNKIKATLSSNISTAIQDKISSKEDVVPIEKIPPSIVSYEAIFNNYRVQHGLEPLIFTSELRSLAQKRVIEIQTNFSHEGIVKYNLGENIVMGVSSGQEALDIWDRSSGHKANMLNPQYTKTGYWRNGGYAVQLFSR
jgi:uncharacterized protein YkwD